MNRVRAGKGRGTGEVPQPTGAPESPDRSPESFLEFYRALMTQARSEPLAALENARAARAQIGNVRNKSAAMLCRLEAHCLHAIGRVKESAELYESAARAFRELGDAEEEARTTIGWVNILALAGQPEEALRVAKRGRPLVRRDPIALARLETNLANAWQLSGQIERAAAGYRAALAQFRGAGSAARWETGLTAYNLGHLLILLDDAPAAKRHLEEARDLFRETAMQVPGLYAETALASMDLAQGRWEPGLAKIASLRDAFAAAGDERAMAWLHRELAVLFSSLGAIQGALKDAKAALQGFRKLSLGTDTAHSAFLCGRLFHAQGSYQEALVHLGEARAHWERVGHTWYLHRTNLELARLLLTTGHPERAMELIQAAKRHCDRYDPHGDGAVCRALAAEAYLETGRPALALRLASRAHLLALRYPAALARPSIALVIARAHADLGQAGEALRWARSSLSALETQILRFGVRETRVLVSESRERIYTRAVDLVLGLSLPNAIRSAVDLISRARTPTLIEDLAQGAGDLPDAATRAAIVRLRDELLARNPGPGERSRQDNLEAQFRRLESRLGRRKRAPALLHRAMTDRALSGWRRRVGDREVVLFDKSSAWRAFVVRASGKVDHVPLPDADGTLREAWIPLRLTLETASRLPAARRTDFLERTLGNSLDQIERLRAAFWNPLPLTARQVVLIPYRDLHHLPLEAFAQSGSVISRLPHPSLLRVSSRTVRATGRAGVDRPRRALLLHGPGAGARDEVHAIAQTLRACAYAVVIGNERRALEAQTEPVDLLHIAAHGRFARGGWARSGIELEDGWMGFEALRNDTLADSLVHFASCESGLSEHLPGSDIEGWITSGLGAGASSLVLSAWRLDDRASHAFSESFYAQWGAGQSVSNAAATARLSVKKHHPHPFHWAAQVVVG